MEAVLKDNRDETILLHPYISQCCPNKTIIIPHFFSFSVASGDFQTSA